MSLTIALPAGETLRAALRWLRVQRPIHAFHALRPIHAVRPIHALRPVFALRPAFALRPLPALMLPALMLAAALATGPAAAAPAQPPRSAHSAPDASLGPHRSLLEGTWEFRSLSRPEAASLAPPAAFGVIVIDRGIVLAASYVKASATRTVGSAWEGRMILGPSSYEVIPEKGFRYDSGTDPQVVSAIPPKTTGGLEHLKGGGIRLLRPDGGTVTFEPGGRRVQSDPDGTTIVHERTSLVPRVPEDLPGRTASR